MPRQKPYKTENTFNNDVMSDAKNISTNSEGLNVRRRDNDDVNDVKISLYDVDYNIKWFIENKIVPTITENNSVITVPVIFGSGDKWASVQRHGYLRDNKGKLLTPLIMIKRNGITRRTDVEDLKVLESPEARITFEKKYSKVNRYDRFSLLTGAKPVREFYSVDVPKYFDVDYEMAVWTNNTSQLNEIIEQLVYFNGKAFGDTYKFITYIDNSTFETVNATGEDRVVRASIGMRTKAYLLNAKGPQVMTTTKDYSIRRTVLFLETDNDSTLNQ